LGALSDRFSNQLVGANALLLMLASWTPGSAMPRAACSPVVGHTAAYALSGAFMSAGRAGARRHGTHLGGG